MSRRRVAILVSGRGSNMAALLDAAAEPDYPAEIVGVASNRPGAGALAIAERAGVATAVVDHTAFPSREAFDAELDRALRAFDPELVCLAGFMRLLTPGFVAGWERRLLNIHPALLPSFKGLDTHARALAAGVKIHGATVHFVVPQMDSGPIIAQGAVPVLDDDTPGTLGERVLAVEHQIFPLALRLLAESRLRVADGRVFIDGGRPPKGVLLAPPPLA